ncbi:MAG: cyclophilin-like fold protein [Planctomycetota bacterium]
MAKIRIESSSVSMTATLNESGTAKKILAILPVEATANRWGKEVYFSIPVKAGEEDPQASVPSGALGYWPPGDALCIFFGQTPYSPVNVVGSLDGDPNEFAKVKDGDAIKVVKAK